MFTQVKRPSPAYKSAPRSGPPVHDVRRKIRNILTPAEASNADPRADTAIQRQEAGRAAPDTTGSSPTVPPLKARLWINAFIPGDAEGAETVPDGPYAGKSMLPGPIPGISDCFLTDNRSFSTNPYASARMHAIYDFEYKGVLVDGVQNNWCDPTHELDCEDGDVECAESGEMPKRVFSMVQSLAASPDKPYINFSASASNPCFTGAPAIDYFGKVEFDTTRREINYRMTLDGYPAYEMYVSIDGGGAISLLRKYPPPGNTPGNLFGEANRLFTGTKTY